MRILAPQQAIRLSVGAALATMAIKVLAWGLTGSIGFLSDALESSVNLAGALFALWMLRWAHEPADEEHPFGHGKAEYFSAIFEAGLISLAALMILGAAGERLLNPRPIEQFGIGVAFAIVASLLNLAVARILLASGRTHRSLAVEADGRHLMTDVWTTVGIIVGVGLAWATGWHWLDPLVAIAVALNILREGWKLMRRSIDGLMDRALGGEEIDRIAAILASYEPRGVRFDNLRTRQAGAQRFANVDLRVPGDWTVIRAHDAADEIERAVGLAVPGLRLETHVEPQGVVHPAADGPAGSNPA
ncbi:MAG: cation diffusion facilitator family transporter [Burkholderiaceae bacterium]|jgi:cation diffusion facilitator family transporter|nr:cation transporter [Gemmatimonadales bacterium]MCO5118264.1 cation diffusion facilitator family transporter [Burkholderiaceae bacterium]MEB2318700.1 cation diffusion facilitator family transporter [Pseudomonadota bacterium]